MKKKLVSKGWYTVIELLFIPFFVLAFFASDISDFQFILLIILGVLSLFVRLFFTTKEEEKEKAKEAKYVKTSEYYISKFFGIVFIFIAFVFLTSFFGDEWSSNVLPFEVDSPAFIIIPALIALWFFNYSSKFKKKKK